MAISSINIQASTPHAFRHNDRTDTPSYLVDTSNENEVDRGHEEAKALLDQYVIEAQKYRKENGLRAIKSDTIKSVEAVLNLNASHNLAAVQRLAQELEKEFGFRAVQIAVHKDEGKDKKEKNYHAHIVMCNLTPQGNTIQRTLKPKDMQKMQDITASCLTMQRGKIGSKAQRLEHEQYKAVKKEQEYNFREYQAKITSLETENTDLKKELHKLNTLVNKGKADIIELEAKLSEALEASKPSPSTSLDNKVDLNAIQKPIIEAQEVDLFQGTKFLVFPIIETKEVYSTKAVEKLSNYTDKVEAQNTVLRSENKDLKASLDNEIEKYTRVFFENVKLQTELNEKTHIIASKINDKPKNEEMHVKNDDQSNLSVLTQENDTLKKDLEAEKKKTTELEKKVTILERAKNEAEKALSFFKDKYQSIVRYLGLEEEQPPQPKPEVKPEPKPDQDRFFKNLGKEMGLTEAQIKEILSPEPEQEFKPEAKIKTVMTPKGIKTVYEDDEMVQ